MTGIHRRCPLLYLIFIAVLLSAAACSNDEGASGPGAKPGVAPEQDDVQETLPAAGKETKEPAERDMARGPYRVSDELPAGTELVAGISAAGLKLQRSDASLASSEVVQVEGMPFPDAVRAQTFKAAARPWDAQLAVPITEGVTAGDTVVVRFAIRCTGTASCRGQTAYIFERAGEPYTKSVENGIQFGSEWETFQFAFRSKESYGPGGANLLFRMGFPEPQTFEVGGVRLVGYGKALQPERFVNVLPAITYAGQEPDAPWRAEAEMRIDRIRKADLTVQVTDEAGKPVSGAEVSVRMKRHAFLFGSAISGEFMYNGKNDPDYVQYRERFAELFNAAVLENELKWPPQEGEWGDWVKPAADETLAWLKERGIAVRGHTLVWPGYANLPRDLPSLAGDKEALRERIAVHIEETAALYKGRLAEWDVVNEPYLNRDLMDILGDDELYAWFRQTRRLDPSAKLYLNEAGLEQEAVKANTEAILRRAAGLKAPIDGLGIQSHFSSGIALVVPEQLYRDLERFAPYVSEIKATEFDMTTGDEQLEAAYLRDYMTVLFSHEKVNGFLMWGFWDGRHWLGNAPVFRKDWSIKPSGQAYKDLVFGRWWTDEEGSSDAKGTYRVRGFRGEYEITVSHGGTVRTATVSLGRDGQTVRIAV